MRLGIVTTQAPFITGGAERHAANLVAALRARGHEATEITLPYKWFPARRIVEHVLAAKLTDLSDLGYPVDRVIGLKFPAWLVQHPDKVFWVLHQHRQAYDLWESGLSELMRDPDGLAVRALIHEEDRAAFTAPGARVWANSANVAGRMKRYLGVEGVPLYHPPPNAGKLRAGDHGDYLFAPSRLGPNKRQALMIEALAHAGPGVRLVIAGPPDDPAYPDRLRALAREHGVADRVEMVGAIPDAEMIRLYAGARAVVFVPIDEDYGYITLEAMLAARPVITVTDAGGPLEFIRDGQDGLVTPPEPAALGAAFARVMQDRAGAERMGAAALASYRASGITWDRVVETLTDGAPPDPAAAPVLDARAEADATDMPAPTQAGLPDLAELAARIAPPDPPALPFVDRAALFAAYEFGTWPGGFETDLDLHAPYFDTHWRRLLATLAHLEGLPGRRILDVGIVPPFVFQAMVAARRPGAEIDGIWQARAPFRQTVRAQAAGLDDLAITIHPANVERDALPLPDGSRDIVLAMEILEHLAVDPTRFLAEANRVLAPGGHLLITTPNMASHRNAAKALAGQAPYSFALFVPVGGVHGRHNREYVPGEIRALGEAAGFETVTLATTDVYDTRIAPEIAALLVARGEDFALRGETIFWIGRKARAPGPAPEAFFHGRPEQLSGRLRLLGRAGGQITLGARNTSRAVWQAEGPFAVGLVLDWTDAQGVMRHRGARLALPGPVAPGEEAAITLALGHGTGRLSIALFEAGAGPFTGAGRSQGVEIACAEAAFLALAGAGA